jgi:hypothetical protein
MVLPRTLLAAGLLLPSVAAEVIPFPTAPAKLIDSVDGTVRLQLLGGRPSGFTHPRLPACC